MNSFYRIFICSTLISLFLFTLACEIHDEPAGKRFGNSAIEQNYADCLIAKNIEFTDYAKANRIYSEYRYILSAHYAENICNHILEK